MQQKKDKLVKLSETWQSESVKEKNGCLVEKAK